MNQIKFPALTLPLDKPRVFQWSLAANDRFKNKTGVEAVALADPANDAGAGIERLAALVWCGLDNAGRRELTVEAVAGLMTLPMLAKIAGALSRGPDGPAPLRLLS